MPSIWLPDCPPITAGADDDEFSNSSLAAMWTEVDHGSHLTVSEDDAGLKLLQSSHAGDSISGIYHAFRAGNGSYWTKVSLGGLPSAGNYGGGIALWADPTSSTADIVTLGFVQQGAARGEVQVTNWTAYNAFSSSPARFEYSVDVGPTALYLRVRRASTTYEFDVSSDGLAWDRIYSTGSLFITPSHIGPMLFNGGTGAVGTARFPFWRYVGSDVGMDGLVKGDRVAVTAL